MTAISMGGGSTSLDSIPNSDVTRVETTLFLLISLDGKITSGESDALDPDWDWTRIHGVKEGLHQYYEIEKTTDLHFLITARIHEKLGVNNPPSEEPARTPVSAVVIDRKPHLTEQGVRNYLGLHKDLYLVTTNAQHPAFHIRAPNLHIIHYAGEIDFPDLFRRLRQEHGIERLTIQSGGTLNSVLLRQGLIDHVSVVVAPLLVGGQATPSLIGGTSLQVEADLPNLKALRLTQCKVLEDSFLHLRYDVLNETIVDPKDSI